jgi:diacylglycerol kinase (ATP)
MGGLLKRALVLINPSARKAQEASHILSMLEKTSYSLIPASEKDPNNFAALIRRFENQVDLVIVGGGDGTIRSVLKPLRESGIPLGIMPLGTANNLARSLNIPEDLASACEILEFGAIKSIDLALANGIPFLNVVGLGLSTQINKAVPKDWKKRWGPLAYGFAGLKIARRMRPFSAKITVDNEQLLVKSLQITVCNGRYYGAGISISPEATLTDGLLHVCSTEVDYWWEGIRLLPRIWRGRLENACGLRTLSGSKIRIETHRPMSVDTDGEVVTKTPLTIDVLPKAIAVMGPKEKTFLNPLPFTRAIAPQHLEQLIN